MHTKPETDTDPEATFGSVFPWVLLVSLMFLLNYLCRATFGPLLPFIEQEFGITHAASTRLLLYLSIGYTSSMFLSGAVASKVRPRFLVAASLVLTGLMLQGVACAPGVPSLALLIFLMGFAAGQYFNAGMSTIRSLVKPSQWSRAVAIHEFGPNAGFIFAPLVAEVGAALLGWRGAVSALGWTTAVAGALFLFFGKGGEYPAAPVSFRGMAKLLGSGRLWLVTWFMGLAIAGQFGPFSVLTLHMVEDRGLSGDVAALLLSSSRAASPLGALAGGLLTAKFGTRKTLVFCLGVYALGLSAMSLPYFAPFVAGMFLQPLFTAAVFPPLFTMLAQSFPLRDQPLLLGIGMPVASFFGVGIMPGILGMFGDHAGFDAGFLVMGVTAALSIALLRFFPAKTPD